ncbi:TPM domain-containing protein [Microbacterium sp. gxy059]|uniref:TPM domain-containing protein n=1 Tax=Microbacterium sp. gxy059 TaxID=2957199 RepID=UPI003D979FBC
MRRLRARVLSALVAAAALVAAPIAAASAADPPQLGSSYVHDEADVLTDAEEQEADARLSALYDDADLELWVVYVDAFENPSEAADWANETADLNLLGRDQYLLAIAVDTRQMFLSPPVEGALSESKLIEVEQAAGRALGSDDWAGAVDAAASELEGQAAPDHTLTWIFGIVIAGVGIFFAVRTLVRSRRGRADAAAAREKRLAELAELEKRAAGAIIEMDDAVRTSRQEIGFAAAQFGDDAVADYGRAIEHAAGRLSQAFELQQRVDAAPAEAIDDRTALTRQILEALDDADSVLDAEAASFDELRRIEQNAPQMLTELRGRRDALAPAPERADAEIARLRETYASPALDDIDDNPEQARQRLAFVDAELAEAERQIAEERTGEAALTLQEAERAIAQTDELVEAVLSLDRSFSEAETQARAIIADLENDIRQAVSLADPEGRVAQAVQETQRHIDTAVANLQSSERTPFLVVESLERANSAIDSVVAGAREAEEARRRVAQRLEQTLGQAQAKISSTDSFIGTRRGAVGSGPRTTLAEAKATFDQALAARAADPSQALALAQQAHSLASSASDAAHRDVQQYDAGSAYGYGGRYTDRRGYGRSSSGLGDAIIGGLIGGAISGGSRRSSSGFGGGFGGSSGGARRSGGGFGGGSRRSSGRSGGISRSSGGRRSGGRRF